MDSAATTKVQHTPGPWKVVCGDDPNDFIVLEPTGNTICEPNEPLFSDLDPELEPGVREITQAEALANAHVIAAAPDGYALALRLLDYFPKGKIDPLLDCDIEIRKMARALVKKAEGRQ